MGRRGPRHRRGLSLEPGQPRTKLSRPTKPCSPYRIGALGVRIHDRRARPGRPAGAAANRPRRVPLLGPALADQGRRGGESRAILLLPPAKASPKHKPQARERTVQPRRRPWDEQHDGCASQVAGGCIPGRACHGNRRSRFAFETASNGHILGLRSSVHPAPAGDRCRPEPGPAGDDDGGHRRRLSHGTRHLNRRGIHRRAAAAAQDPLHGHLPLGQPCGGVHLDRASPHRFLGRGLALCRHLDDASGRPQRQPGRISPTPARRGSLECRRHRLLWNDGRDPSPERLLPVPRNPESSTLGRLSVNPGHRGRCQRRVLPPLHNDVRGDEPQAAAARSSGLR